MKVKHWIAIILVVIGGLYVLHNYQSHGGFQGVKGGLGFNS